MDASIAKLLEVLQHLVRDILNYVIPSTVLIAYVVYVINRYGFSVRISELIAIQYFEILYIIISYILGQLLMSVMLVLVEPKLEERISKKMKIEPSLPTEKEISVFVNNRAAYDYFIERSNQLYYLRWNLAGAFLMILIIHTIAMLTSCWTKFDMVFWEDILLTVTSVLLFVLMLILHYKTAEEYTNRVNYLFKNDSPNRVG